MENIEKNDKNEINENALKIKNNNVILIVAVVVTAVIGLVIGILIGKSISDKKKLEAAREYIAAYEEKEKIKQTQKSEEVAVEPENPDVPVEEVVEENDEEILSKAIDMIFTNSDEALESLEKLANEGNTDAMFLVGYIYDYVFVDQKADYEKAYAWYEKSMNDNIYAKSCMAILTRYGLGTEKNEENARNIFEEVSKELNEDQIEEVAYAGIAYELIGCLYEDGLLGDVDYEKAKSYYEKAEKLGNPIAINDLGYVYEMGIGVEQDYEKAREQYEKAAELGNARAMNNLGYMYEEAMGIGQDYDEARKWYEKAAEQGLSAAMNNLGYMYYLGNGVEKDEEEAKKWYEKAAASKEYEAIDLFVMSN